MVSDGEGNPVSGVTGVTGAPDGQEPPVSAGPSSEVGRAIGEFELREVIGRGGMGTVYKAWQRSLKRLVALKVLAPYVGGSPKAIERFQREAQAAAKLHHPNIVPIFALGEDNGTYYYAMELVDGQGLNEIIRHLKIEAGLDDAEDDLEETRVLIRGSGEPVDAGQDSAMGTALTSSDTHVVLTAPVSGHVDVERRFEVIAENMADVADAVAYAHQEGVIHRDIKPHNLVMSREGRLSVTDFGLARVLEQPGITMTSECLGSPLYMAPEQLSGTARGVDPRTDVYSLGVTLYEWLTLSPPYAGRNRETVIRQIVTGEVRAARQCDPSIPLDLETICARAMERDPRRRYQSAAAMRDDLRAFAAGRGIRAKRVSWVERGRRLFRYHQVGTLTATAVVLMVALGAIIWQQRATIRDMRDGAPAVTDATNADGNAPTRDRVVGGGPPPPAPTGVPAGASADGAKPDIARVLDQMASAVLSPLATNLVKRSGDLFGESGQQLTGTAERIAKHGLERLFSASADVADIGTLANLDRLAAQEVFGHAAPVQALLSPIGIDDINSLLLSQLLEHPKPEVAIEQVTKRFLDLDANDHAARYVRTLLYGHSGQFDLMAQDAGELIERRPADPYPLLIRALARLMMSRPQRALTDISAAIKLDAGMTMAYGMRGLAELHLNHSDMALAAFDEALGRSGLAVPSVFILMGRSFAYSGLRRYPEAIADLTAVLTQQPRNVDALVLRGDCYRALGRYGEASRDFELSDRMKQGHVDGVEGSPTTDQTNHGPASGHSVEVDSESPVSLRGREPARTSPRIPAGPFFGTPGVHRTRYGPYFPIE